MDINWAEAYRKLIVRSNRQRDKLIPVPVVCTDKATPRHKDVDGLVGLRPEHMDGARLRPEGVGLDLGPIIGSAGILGEAKLPGELPVGDKSRVGYTTVQ